MITGVGATEDVVATATLETDIVGVTVDTLAVAIAGTLETTSALDIVGADTLAVAVAFIVTEIVGTGLEFAAVALATLATEMLITGAEIVAVAIAIGDVTESEMLTTGAETDAVDVACAVTEI